MEKLIVGEVKLILCICDKRLAAVVGVVVRTYEYTNSKDKTMIDRNFHKVQKIALVLELESGTKPNV